ncbi:MAG: methyltransferase domain-containing protein [Burkholderiaceae bacterium]|nr:methyltransferase domain-containing protein [Burkholderiaceae bacterium]
MLQRSLIAIAAVVMVLGGTACAQLAVSPATEAYTPEVGQPGKDVVWVPTPQALVDLMLDMARLTPQDRLVDLGSGDGVTVITAAKRGATARGIEFNPDMVALARQRAEAQGVADRATFEQADIFETDFSQATVVTLFLLPSLNMRLRPILFDMPPGTRIVSNSFNLGDWEADETGALAESCPSFCRALMWVVPAKVAGTWEIDGRTLELSQSYQRLHGSLRNTMSMRALDEGRLEGARIRFSIGEDRYVGEVSGETMRGTVNGSRPWQARRTTGS